MRTFVLAKYTKKQNETSVIYTKNQLILVKRFLMWYTITNKNVFILFKYIVRVVNDLYYRRVIKTFLFYSKQGGILWITVNWESHWRD